MPNILIVDDQPHLQEFLAQELMDEGHKVVCVYDIVSANAYLKDSRPDLVLLDLYLNGLEGWDALHEIKGSNPNIPVLIVTAYDSYVDDPRVSMADGYVVKSFQGLNELKQKIAHLLKQVPHDQA